MSTSHFAYAAILFIHPSKIFLGFFTVPGARGQKLLIDHSGSLFILDLKIICVSCVPTLRILKMIPFGFLPTYTQWQYVQWLWKLHHKYKIFIPPKNKVIAFPSWQKITDTIYFLLERGRRRESVLWWTAVGIHWQQHHVHEAGCVLKRRKMENCTIFFYSERNTNYSL